MALSRTARRYAAVLLVALPVAVGCGTNMPQVSGTVTIDGERLDGGIVTFVADGKPTAASRIASDGTYQLKTGDSTGVAEGEYRVTVSAYKTKPSTDGSGEPMPVLATPAKYNRAETTDIVVDVVAGSNEIDLDLVSGSR